MDGMERINEMWAMVVVDDDGTEGIPAFLATDGTQMPMVGADTARVAQLRPLAQDFARQLGKPIEVIRFTVREHIDTIEP